MKKQENNERSLTTPEELAELAALYDSYGVRPVISLKPGTTVASGTGIATDPWTINE